VENPRQAEVWGKKPEVADRTINERKYCKPCDYYYSEMYTCPICYGDDRAVDRIIKLLEDERSEWLGHDGECDCRIKGLEIERLIELIKGETNERPL
jgi:hypothetical protein